jgi:SAM-dependent methyltransferase
MPNGNPYGVDLAYTHDVGFGDFARNAAQWLLEILAQCPDRSRLVVDLGCGSGIWAAALAEAGYSVVGVDFSADMIDIARRRVATTKFAAAKFAATTFHVASFVDFAVPPCRSVTALGEVFNYLFDPQNSLPMLRQVCQRVFDALVPGGVFIFDVAEPGRSAGRERGFYEGEDWACLVEYLHDEPRRQLTRRIVSFRRVGETYRRHEEIHRQQLFDRAAIVDMLRGIGFQAETVPGYGQQPFPPGVIGFVARKV